MTDFLDRVQPALVNRYRVERQLYGGGMTVAYLAQDQELGRPALVKVLRPELAAKLDTERFMQEISAAARLDHPNILAAYDFGQSDGLLYYVMPFIEAEALRQLLHRKRWLSIEETCDIGCHVAAALEHAHAQNIVHRNIRPETILLPIGQAVVPDFGVSRAVSIAVGGRIPEPKFSRGRPYYMSPELALGLDIDGRSDLYSLGAVLFEVLTGEKPFEGDSVEQIVSHHRATPVREPQDVEPRVPAWLSAVIVRCMQKAPADRFESAGTLLQALEARGTTVRRSREFRKVQEAPTATEAAKAEGAPKAKVAPRAPAPPQTKEFEAPQVPDVGTQEVEEGEHAPLADLGVGEIVQGAGWDFDDLMSPEVKPPPQPVYDLDAAAEPSPSPATAPRAREAAPATPPPATPEPIRTGGDLIPGAWFETNQAESLEEAPPEPVVEVDELEADTDLADAVHFATSADDGAEAGAFIEPLPAPKRLQLPPWLSELYDWGPELLVRLGRQRRTWYYLAGGVGVILGLVLMSMAVSAVFFRRPTVHYQTVRNALVEPVHILMDGQTVHTLQPGQQDSLLLPRDREVVVSWRLVRPRQNGQEMGEEFEAVLTDTNAVVTGIAAGRAMFAPRVTNYTNQELVALVNPRSSVELRCNCVIPARSQNVRIGYYPLLESSSIRFFAARRPYRGRFQEIGDFFVQVDTVSGAVGISIGSF